MIRKICRFLVCGVLVIVFVGCTPISVLPTITATLPSTSTSTIAPTATSIPLATTSQPLNFFFPKVEKSCPEDRDVSVDKLGIDADSRIILSDLDQTGLWSLDSTSLSPELIQELPIAKWISKSISPDGKMLAYTIGNPDRTFSTWLFSLDSGEHSEIVKIDYFEGATLLARWLSQNTLMLAGNCTGSGCPFPLKVINVISGEILDIDNTHRDPYDIYLEFYENDGKYSVLYSSYTDDDHIKFYMYDYSSGQKVQIFPWLQNRIFFYPYRGTNLGLDFYLTEIFMMVEQSYGYDFGVVDASVHGVTQNTSYDSLMKRVVTDDYFDELDFSFVVLSPTNDTLLMSMSYKDYVNGEVNNDLNVTPKVVENAFFTVGLEDFLVDEWANHLVFKDYCLTTSEYYFTDISPDGNITTLSSDTEIMLINLETGYVSRLPGWSYIGWAR